MTIANKSPAVSVHGVLTGPTDTEMTRELDIPKASPIAGLPGASSGTLA